MTASLPRSPGRGAIELCRGNGCRYAEFGGDRADRGRSDGEVGLAVGGEIRCDERLVVGAGLVDRVSPQERADVPDRGVGIVMDHPQRTPVGAHDGLNGEVVRGDVGGVDGYTDGGDLEVVTDPG